MAGLLLCGDACIAWAQPPADSEPKGDFLSSLKQAFRQDFDHEVVRGHFEVGSEPDAHRYYCLVDPNTGKSELNGVAGKPYVRPDGMTGIKGAAVSFYSCADAEQKGILVTTGYALSGVKVPITPPQVAKRAAPAPAPAPPAELPAPRAAAAPMEAAVPKEAPAAREPSADREVLAVYSRLIAGQNSHDRATVSELLLDSKDLVLAQPDGSSIWGHQGALEALEKQWQGTWKLEPQAKEPRISSVSPTVAILITPMTLTQGASAETAASVAVRWGGVFVKTKPGWRISAIFISPYKDGVLSAGN